MNILLLGSGGREHAIAWKLKKSPNCENLFIAPGNAGTTQCGENVDLDPEDFKSVGDFVLKNQIGLVIVGPEAPLVMGITDYFRSTSALKSVLVVGPDKEGAQLEGSKDWSKKFMQKYNIPTASYRTFVKDELEDAMAYLDTHTLPIVLKADGLAAGKGVIICEDRDDAKKEIKEMLADAKFGSASSRVVVEQFLDGIELSVFAISDGRDYKLLPTAKDYKRIGEGDTGPNTGGMGAISPVPFADEAFMKKVKDQIIHPTMSGLKLEGIDYRGFIFFGLINVKGNPMVIEYNARMGDPETEVVIPRLESDFVDLMIGCASGNISDVECKEIDDAGCTVILVSGGYPNAYEKGHEITGIDEINNSIIFHAGTKGKDSKFVTSGGRVIAVTTIAPTLKEALSNSFKNAEKINFKGKNYRKDIGYEFN
ncbi:MAG: phosphoribosylamine--glycine ligase [Sphingobacteriales bacterium]|jgi:phosphoribosylamine--glycine ligase